MLFRSGISSASLWATRVAWSNLYKVAPANGGNPNSDLKDSQFDPCLELIQSELTTYNPRAVVFLTENPGGEPWFQPFREKLEWTDFKSERETLVVGSGRIRVNGTDYFAVIAEHPQGRPEEELATLISEILNQNAPLKK